MQFLHQREYLNEGDVVVVDCSHRCNIRLMGDSDFQSYRRAVHTGTTAAIMTGCRRA